MRLRWEVQASEDLIAIAEYDARATAKVIAAMEWMARTGFSLGRAAELGGPRRYWPVPPLGVYYRVADDLLLVTAVRDSRRRREAW